MQGNIFIVSLTMSSIIILLLIISPFLRNRYSAKWCYFVWLILALRLIIPIRFELPFAPVNLPVPSNQTIILNQDGTSGLKMIDDHPEKGNGSSFSPSPVPSASDSAPTSGHSTVGYTSIITLQQLLLAVWALGAILFFLIHIIIYLKFRRKTKQYCLQTDYSVLDSMLEEMKIKRGPQLFLCSRIASPMLTGFFQPVILLPDVNYTSKELEVVLKHELTHYRRRDIWYKMLLLVANSVHWFNPLVYLMVNAANRDLEYSCDDAVVKNSDLDFRKEYSLTILKSMQHSQQPLLSTNFSETSDKARKRFANILDRKNKKSGITALVLVLALVGITGTLVACNNGPVKASNGNGQTNNNNRQQSFVAQPIAYDELLYKFKGTYTGDNSKVGAIVHTLNFTNLPVKSFELQTGREPYGITVNYQVDSRANYRFYDDIETAWNKNAAVMFSLIPNADEISFRLYDQYGDFAGSYYNRKDLNQRMNMEYFTTSTVKESTVSLDSFGVYLNKVSAIENTISDARKQSIEMHKQIYNVIGDDSEITLNSGVGYQVTITDEFAMNPPIKELGDQKDKLDPYTGKKVYFLLYNIHNFKTDNYTYYLFAFDETKLIAYADLKTVDSEQNAIRILSALQ